MDTIFVGIKGTVVAIDRSTGKTLWKTDLKGADFVNVTLQDGDRTLRGRVAGVRDDGALLLDVDGETRAIVSGELVRGPRRASS